jgi:hypothetical protein
MTNATRHFLRHFLEMLLAMLVGMVALGWTAELVQSPDVAVLLMATAMYAPMAAWMRYRGHSLARAAEMGGAMFVPAAGLIALHLLGVVPGESELDALHAAMVPSMLTAMLIRREDYSRPPAPLGGRLAASGRVPFGCAARR